MTGYDDEARLLPRARQACRRESETPTRLLAG